MGTDESLSPDEHIFHIATVEDWQEAQLAGDYRVSTLGRSLADEGFILLEIDPARLDVELRLEVPPGADEAFPHIYGPLPLDAVIGVRELA